MGLKRSVLVVVSIALLGGCSRGEDGRRSPSSDPIVRDPHVAVAPPEVRGQAGKSPEAADFVILPVKGEADLGGRLRAEAANAKQQGLKPFAYLYASWCKPCAAINKYMGDPSMKDAFKGTYVVKLSIDDFEPAALTKAGLRADGVPFFFQLDDTGRSTGKTITSSVWGEDIPANMAPPLKKFFSS